MKLFKYIHKYWKHGLFELRLFKVRWSNIDAYIEEGVKVDCQSMVRLGRGSSIRRFSTIIAKDKSHSTKQLSSLEIGGNTYIGEYNNKFFCSVISYPLKNQQIDSDSDQFFRPSFNKRGRKLDWRATEYDSPQKDYLSAVLKMKTVLQALENNEN